MASTSKRKGYVAVAEWAKHLRPWGKRQQAKKVRKDGKQQVNDES